MRKSFAPFLVAVTIALLPLIAFAQEGEHEGHHESGLPIVVYLQAINFLLYAGMLYYFLRTPVRAYFTGRQAAFNAALTKAAAAKAEAEARKREIETKIRDLQANAAQELARAKTDAQALEARILKEAEEISSHLRTEANRTASFEIERAKNNLRTQLLRSAIEASRESLGKTIGSLEQKRLQTEFVDKIQVVGQ